MDAALVPYRMLVELAERQRAALAAGELDAHARLGAERDRLVRRLAPPIDPVGAAEARALLERALALDADGRESLRQAMDAARADLRHLQLGGRAVRAYLRPAGAAPRPGLLA